MLIELVRVVKFPSSPWLAQIRTPLGGTSVRWCGDQAAGPGEYHVEWTVDEDIAWGRNAKPATEAGPGLRSGGRCVVLRGRLNLTVDGAAVLDLDGTQVLLDLAAPLSEGLAGTWVELFLEREKVALHPFQL
ncbi:hypothetical protein [Streptomyces sp. NBC_00385]|uniref:hypothetical protein n=1 Tax=Streptomyces sp. NBC_00385 TaxID=2975733 RepID=UPI002DDA2909|nr:hypothetical protein [Streptomyces sp. NBC_00385]WRZ05035.1 hypothetical protein OG959_17545 [Streptomyces sp. NBC_00385]